MFAGVDGEAKSSRESCHWVIDESVGIVKGFRNFNSNTFRDKVKVAGFDLVIHNSYLDVALNCLGPYTDHY
jgi:hypothetical protein